MKKYIIASAITFAALTSAKANAACQTTIENTAAMTLASQKSVAVSSIALIRTNMGAWTEAVANNTGVAEVAVALRSKITYYQVTAQQIGTTAECEVRKVRSMDPAEIDPAAKQAETYKLAIGNVMHISESDDTWSVFYTNTTVSSLSQEDLAKALRTDEPIDIYSVKETLEFLNHADADDEEERFNFSRLTELLKKDFKDFRVIKVGQPDSGALFLYILGISKDGKLVGLVTTSVET